MSSQRGFTLMELVLVIIVLGVLSVTAMPRVDTEVFDARAAARELVGAIRYAQHQAMSHSGSTPYAVTAMADDYRVTHQGNDIADPMTGAAVFRSGWTDVTLDTAGTIAFDGKGKPSCTGFAACSLPGDQDVKIRVTAGGRSVTVKVERYTGYARIL